MKKCKHCQTEIDDKAKICPNCRKKQGMPVWLIIIIVIIAISIFSSLGSDNTSSSEENKTGTTTETLTLLDGHTGNVDGNYTYEITVTVQNNTNNEYSYVSIEFYAYDSAGNMLDTCSGYNSGLEPNGKWKFTATCYLSNGDARKVSSYKLKEITKW